MKSYSISVLLVFMILYALPALSSDTPSPVGRWKTIDDKTSKPKSIMDIAIKGDTLVATIDSLYREPGDDPDPICDKCSGWRKDKKAKGLTITDAMTKHGNEWSGGFITDPDNGKTYRCIIRMQDNGKRMEVRGFIGFSLFGRSQYWYRIK